MNFQNSIILKKISVQIPQNTSLGINSLFTKDPINIFLPAGTLLESGNVRIPFDTVENNESILEKVESNDVAGGIQPDCNNQNIIYFSDQFNNIFSTIPNNLDNIPIGNGNQVCYCQVPENSDLKINNNVNIKLNENLWCTLNKGTRIKLIANTEVEFRVNGNWHRIKLIKDEFFKI